MKMKMNIFYFFIFFYVLPLHSHFVMTKGEKILKCSICFIPFDHMKDKGKIHIREYIDR